MALYPAMFPNYYCTRKKMYPHPTYVVSHTVFSIYFNVKMPPLKKTRNLTLSQCEMNAFTTVACAPIPVHSSTSWSFLFSYSFPSTTCCDLEWAPGLLLPVLINMHLITCCESALVSSICIDLMLWSCTCLINIISYTAFILELQFQPIRSLMRSFLSFLRHLVAVLTLSSVQMFTGYTYPIDLYCLYIK